MLIFDLGGGILMCQSFTIEDGLFEVKSIAGDICLEKMSPMARSTISLKSSRANTRRISGRTRGLSVASILLLSLLSALSLPAPRPVLRLIPSMKESTSDLKN